MEQFNEADYNKKRLELFTHNDQNIEKINVSNDVLTFIKETYIAPLGNSVEYHLFNYFVDNIPSILNESLALVVFPYFTDILTTHQKIKVEGTESGGFKMTKDQFGFMTDDYESVADFLSEPTGALIKTENFFNLRYYSDTMKDSLRRAFELNFHYLEKVFVDENEDLPPRMISLSVEETKDKMIEALMEDVFQTVSNLPLKSLFTLYGLSTEKQKWELAQEDTQLFRQQFDMLNEFIKSLKTHTEKKIIVKTKEPLGGNIDSCDFYINQNNAIQTKDGGDAEQLFEHFLNKTLYNFEAPGSIIVQESTSIKASDGEPQLKVCGLMIKERDFIPIDKDTLKEMYQYIMQLNDMKDANSYRFFDWFYGCVPSFNE